MIKTYVSASAFVLAIAGVFTTKANNLRNYINTIGAYHPNGQPVCVPVKECTLTNTGAFCKYFDGSQNITLTETITNGHCTPRVLYTLNP